MSDPEKQVLVIEQPAAGGGGGCCSPTVIICLLVLAVFGVGAYFLYAYVLSPLIAPLLGLKNAISNPVGTIQNQVSNAIP